MKLRVIWGHAQARQLKRVLAGAGGDFQGLLERVDEVPQQG